MRGLFAHSHRYLVKYMAEEISVIYTTGHGKKPNCLEVNRSMNCLSVLYPISSLVPILNKKVSVLDGY